MKTFLVAAALSFLVGCQGDPYPVWGCPTDNDAGAETSSPGGPIVHRAYGIPPGVFGGDAGSDVGTDTSLAAPDDLTYHGGAILADGVTVYLIWYGDWTGNTATTIIPEYLSHLGGSPYFQINADYDGYTNASPTGVDADGGLVLSEDKSFVANSLTLGKQVFDSYSHGTFLTQGNIQDIVRTNLTSGTLPSDPNAIYMVLTSKDVKQSLGIFEFCGWFCGWHDHLVMAGFDVKYAFIGNTEQCPESCSPDNDVHSPNDNIGADGMISVISHEIDETVTDPDENAWFLEGWGKTENGDKCAWKFGTTWAVPNGANANMKLNGKDYYVQQNWVLATPYTAAHCAMSK
jgi:hypothetical protein